MSACMCFTGRKIKLTAIIVLNLALSMLSSFLYSCQLTQYTFCSLTARMFISERSICIDNSGNTRVQPLVTSSSGQFKYSTLKDDDDEFEVARYTDLKRDSVLSTSEQNLLTSTTFHPRNNSFSHEKCILSFFFRILQASL